MKPFRACRFMLCHEHDDDPEMHPEPISAKQREDVIMQMVSAAGREVAGSGDEMRA